MKIVSKIFDSRIMRSFYRREDFKEKVFNCRRFPNDSFWYNLRVLCRSEFNFQYESLKIRVLAKFAKPCRKVERIFEEDDPYNDPIV